MSESEITLRPIAPEDEEVLFELFCSAHRHKFASLELPEEGLNQLLRIQFEGQRRDFARTYPNASYDLVLKSGEPAGQFFVSRMADHITVIDVTFLPRYRTGIATRLVRNLLREARASGVLVRAHVERMNSAWNLWKRLGFRIVGENEAYWALEYPALPPSGENLPGT